MNVAAKAQDFARDSLNAQGRSPGHIAIGLGVCVAAIAATGTIAALRPQPVAPGARPVRKPLMKAVWPALFSATTLAAVRIWNAPSSPQRTRTLSLWAALQGMNAMWMLLSPRDRRLQIVAALSTAGVTALYAHSAADIDQKAAGIAAPSGFAGLSALIAKP